MAGDFSKTDRDRARKSPIPGRSRFCGSGDANFTNGRRRRGGGAVQHAPQSARARSLSADRAGALLETAFGWRVHQSVRNEPEFSERRHFTETKYEYNTDRSL